MVSDKGKLTARQKKFVTEYVRCLNASEAARRAGYSQKTAYSIGHENLNKPDIKAEIQRLLEDKSMSGEEVVARLASHARGDMADLIDPATLTLDWKKAKEAGVTHLIKKIKQTTITGDEKDTHIFEVELYDAQKALVHLGKTMAMFTDKKEVNHKGHVKHTLLDDLTDDELDALLDE